MWPSEFQGDLEGLEENRISRGYLYRDLTPALSRGVHEVNYRVLPETGADEIEFLMA